MITDWNHYWTTNIETLEVEDKAASPLNNHRYKLEMNTLEREGRCKSCQAAIKLYKRQYRDHLTGNAIQCYCMNACICHSVEGIDDSYEQVTY